MEQRMFETSKPGNGKRNLALFASLLLHGVVLFLWLDRAPLFVQPSSVAWGQRGLSHNVVYVARQIQSDPAHQKSLLRAKVDSRKSKDQLREPVESGRAGAPAGSLSQGPAIGTEARPAFPVVFPDPAIYPGQLAKGLQGDVVVEVTIDEQGNVTETRILQSLQQDIDAKVLDTLKNWRFKPATVDGVAISSRQDVHFHFPS
jgi:TonB family protein